MNIPFSLTPAGISRRTAIVRLGMLGGAFLARNFLGDAFAQTATAPDFVTGVRKMLAAIPPTSTPLAEGVQLISGPGGNIAAFTWAEGKLVIDSGIAGASDAIFAKIDSFGPQPL